MSTHEHPIDDLIKIGAAANALGVSVDTMRRWERAGRIVFERRGNQTARSSLERLAQGLEDGRVGGLG